MCKKKNKYIKFEDFVHNAGVAETTIKRNYKQIPGISKEGKVFRVISGTRYPYRLRGAKIDDHGTKKYVLLKAIDNYKYISHKELRIEPKQFENMLRELLSAELIQPNGLCNYYGANAYDSTDKGSKLIRQTDKKAKSELIDTIASAAGTFTGAVLSQIYDAA